MKNINATLLQQPGAPEQTVGGTRQKGNYASAAHLLQQRQKLQNATSQDLMLEYDLVEKKDDDMLHSHLSGFLRFLHAEDAVERANFIQRVKQEAGKISGGGASTGEPFGGDQDHAGQGQGVGVVPAALADNLVFGESLKEDTGVQLWDFYQRDLRVDEEAEDLVLERQRTRDAAHDVEKEDGRTRRRRVYTDFRDKKDTSKRRTSGSTLRTHTSTKLPTNRRQKGRVAMKDRNRSSLLKTRTLRLPSGTKDGLDGTIAKLARSRNSTSSHKKGAVVVPDKINATDVVLAPPEQQQAEKSILKIQRDQIFTPQQDPTLYLTSPFTTMSVGHGLEPEVGNAVFLAAAKELLLWQIFGTKDGGLLLGGGGRGTAKMGPRGAAPNRDAEDDVTLSTETVFNTPGRKLFSAARNMFENQDGGGSRTTSRGGGNPSTDDTAVEQEGAVADQLSSVVHAEDSALKQVRATLEYPSNDADVGQVQPHKELSNDVVKLGDDVSIRVEYEFDNTNSFYHDRIFQTFTFRDHSRSLSYELEVVAVQQSGEPSDVERLRPGEVVDAGAATHATGTTAGAASSSSLLPLPIFVPCSHWRTEAVTVSI
ncbi:unnamed protein product [Amoebophrya sp. A120]|nr:unnamed protein product [Amoebophrya sp. A120]|eukprot:GSA120T00014370001.1